MNTTTKKTFLFSLFLAGILLGACHRHTAKNKDIAQSEAIPSTTVTEMENRGDEDSTFAIYRRTPCFGMCPSFDLTIYKSGYAVYEGKNFVNRIGFYRTSFLITDLEKIKSTAERIHYFGLNDVYDNEHVTDLPSVTTGVWEDGKLKTVRARYHAPVELKALYEVLDTMMDKAQWTQMETEPRKQ
ncbi:MAG: hypothetical protein IT223_03480 [Crocinitomicaceae bacterium]|nr:hypothetical protein [Crocinitomicaceae bacterium]